MKTKLDPTTGKSSLPLSKATGYEQSNKGQGRKTIFFALLTSVAALVTAVYCYYMLQQSHEQLQSYLQTQNQQTEQCSEGRQDILKLNQRLNALPSAEETDARARMLSNLQLEQQQQQTRLAQLSGRNQQRWRLDEASHLVQLANLRLSAMQDIRSAQALLSAADQILKSQDDPASFAAREQLAKVSAQLKQGPQADKVGTYLALAQLQHSITVLVQSSPQFTESLQASGSQTDKSSSNSENFTSWFQPLIDYFSGFFRLEKKANNSSRQILSNADRVQYQLAITLLIQQAQWAVLQGEAQVYKSALSQAQGLLKEAYGDQSQTVQQRMHALSLLPIQTEVPSLAEAQSSVNAYVRSRESIPSQDSTQTQSEDDISNSSGDINSEMPHDSDKIDKSVSNEVSP